MKETKDLSKTYLWLDTEFTSLDLDCAQLLQLAIVATDARLKRIFEPATDLNIYFRLKDDSRLSPWVAENLRDLLNVCRSSKAVSIAAARVEVENWLFRNFGEQRPDISMRPIIAGNSLFCDLSLIRRSIPELSDFANYRILDVSAWKVHLANAEMLEPFDKDSIESIESNLTWPRVGTGGEHDAYFDVQASIAELNYYTNALSAKIGDKRCRLSR